jgi:hypothetical protein
MSARREASDPRQALLSAIEARDVAKVRCLLEAGADPVLMFKGKIALFEAVNTGSEELLRLLIEKSRASTVPNLPLLLNTVACWIFASDSYSVELAHEMSVDINIRGTGIEGDPHCLWAQLLGPTLAGVIHRDAERLAGKVRLAVGLGWQPGIAWASGHLPHHGYIEAGFIEAALACVEAGANSDEPTRHKGLGDPRSLKNWPEFQARLLANKSLDEAPVFTATRLRQRP